MDNRKYVAPSFEKDVRNLVALIEKGNLYPIGLTKKRVFHENFWWDIVRPSKEKVGSDRAKAKEVVQEDDHVQRLFDFLVSDERNEDYKEFELEDPCVNDDADGEQSVVSSTMGSCEDMDEEMILADNATEWDGLPEENWETMSETERDTTINGNLKKLGNVKKQCMSPLILKDLLGDDANAGIAQLKTKHLRKKQQEDLFINDIYRSVKYFAQKFKRRREILLQCAEKSKKSSYERKEYWHREMYKQIIANKKREAERHAGATQLVGHKDLPKDAIKMITGASADVFGISSPREFQHVGIYHCITNDDTVLAVPRKTSDGKSLVVQLASFFQKRCNRLLGTIAWTRQRSG